MTNPGIYGLARSTGSPVKPPTASNQVIDLVGDPEYGVSVNNDGYKNASIIQKAFADIQGPKAGYNVYLRGASRAYRCGPLTVPSVPFEFYGDNPFTSVLMLNGGTTPLMVNDNGVPTSGPFSYFDNSNQTIPQPPSQFWIGNIVNIHDLGLWGDAGGAGAGHKAIYFTPQSGQKCAYLLQRLYVYGFKDDGITLRNSGNLLGHFIKDCYVYNVYGNGIVMGSDTIIDGCVVANSGAQGFYSNGPDGSGTNMQISHCNAYGCGWLTAASGIGLHIKDPGAGVVVTNFYAQDCQAEGAVIQGTVTDKSHVVVNGLISDSCSRSSVGTYSGLRVEDSSNVTVLGYFATDRNFQSTVKQTHALKVVNPNSRNQGNLIQVQQDATNIGFGLPTIGSIIDAASDLTGTHVLVGGAGLITADAAPTEISYVQPGGSVTVNRKFTATSNASIAGGAFLGSGATLRIL